MRSLSETKALFRVNAPHFTFDIHPEEWTQITSPKFARKISLVRLRRCMLPLLSAEVKAELVRLHPSQFYWLSTEDQRAILQSEGARRALAMFHHPARAWRLELDVALALLDL